MDANATGATNLDIGNDQVIPEDINISDVIEVIETDMFNGGGEIPGTSSGQPTPSGVQHQKPYVKIIEQPASKALRFRYECEGRSAGSIPGASSTPENKTYPTIKIFGYTGRAVVVVSCVTKDAPYRPHPHSLVGREGCKKGVCTMEVPPETMTVVFSNLGIQCVKKKDIEQALRIREQIRVDPFQTKFSHKNQPTSIDLNAVRLCFQVFLEGAPKKYTVPLQPIVSDIIYDKKAMSDLVIVKLSHCTCPVDGGRDDFILLCEKVAKEDIQIRFYEERDGQLVWEGFGDFQPSQVHKQTGIWYRPPRYKTLEVTEPVRVFIQLRRPSDGAASEPLPFEYLPLDSGRPAYWSFRRTLAKKVNNELFNSILSYDAELKKKEVVKKNVVVEGNNNYLEKVEEKSFNELIQQVAELDEIYSETKKVVGNQVGLQQNDSFDDAKTYTSLQLAFKEPVDIPLTEEVVVIPASPVIDVPVSGKRENGEKLPPLPPKRQKKIETAITGSTHSIQLTGKQAEGVLHGGSMQSVNVIRTQSFNLHRPKSHNELLVPPGKRLPPPPAATLPNPKKRGFFSKLFGRKTKSPNPSRESSVLPSKTNSFSSLQVEKTTNLARSNSNLSTKSAASIRIPLKGTPPESTENLTQQKTENDFVMCLDLTEAEHYALYMTMAPHATQSEFDEFSCYYAPVEGGKILEEDSKMKT